MHCTRIYAYCIFAVSALALCDVAASAARVDCVAARGRSNYKIESRCARIELNEGVRTYRIYTPKSRPSSAMPVILVLHGGGGSGSNMEAMTLGQFNRLADQHRLIVIYPDGVGRSWNDGRSDLRAQSVQEGVDDVGFLRAVVADVEKSTPVDRRRIYATGISNGGMMSFRLACDAPNFVAAVAPVAANLSVELAEECKPSRVVPMAIVDGTDDPIMPWLGGEIKVLWNRRGEVLSAEESFNYWAKLGDCALPNTHMSFNRERKSTSVITHVARDCAKGIEVRLYEIVGGGHTWPGGQQYLGERIVGKASRDLNATQEIWQFFSRYRL